MMSLTATGIPPSGPFFADTSFGRYSNDFSRASIASVRCRQSARSEEHTSELQSHLNLVCRLLLEQRRHTLASFLSCTQLVATRRSNCTSDTPNVCRTALA